MTQAAPVYSGPAASRQGAEGAADAHLVRSDGPELGEIRAGPALPTSCPLAKARGR